MTILSYKGYHKIHLLFYLLLNNSIFFKTLFRSPLTLSLEYNLASAASAEKTTVFTPPLKIA